MFLRINPDAYKSVGKNATLEERMQELVKEMDNIRDNWMPDVKNDTDELSSWCMQHVLRWRRQNDQESFTTISVVQDFRKASKTSCRTCFAVTGVDRGGNESPEWRCPTICARARWCTSSGGRAGTSLLLCAKNAEYGSCPARSACGTTTPSFMRYDRQRRRPRKGMVRGISDRDNKLLIGDTGRMVHILSPTRYLFLPRSKSMLLPSKRHPSSLDPSNALTCRRLFSTSHGVHRQLRFQGQ
jgi:hypothetical protein